MEKEKIRYGVERSNIFVKISVIFLTLSVLLRLLSGWGFWKNDDKGYAYMQLLLPTLCCVFLAILLLYGGKKFFSLTVIPVAFGALFFIIRAFDFTGVLRTVLCVAVYVLVLLLWCGTVFGVIRTKWLLPPVFALALAYKLFLDKTVDFANMSFKALLPELSVICMILAMLMIPFAMKKRDFSEKSPEEQATIDVLLENEEPLEEVPEEIGKEENANE